MLGVLVGDPKRGSLPFGGAQIIANGDPRQGIPQRRLGDRMYQGWDPAINFVFQMPVFAQMFDATCFLTKIYRCQVGSTPELTTITR